MTGKVWTSLEEVELRTLVDSNFNVGEISAKLQKTPKSVIAKLNAWVCGFKLKVT